MMTKEKRSADEKNKISEERILQNKARRKAERRCHTRMMILTAFLVLALSLTIGGFLSQAKSSSEQINYKYYKSIIIRQGDSLWSIAQSNKPENQTVESYVSEMKQINHLREDEINAGNYLIIPYYTNEFVASGTGY